MSVLGLGERRAEPPRTPLWLWHVVGGVVALAAALVLVGIRVAAVVAVAGLARRR